MYNPENDVPRMWSRNEMIALLKEVVSVEITVESEYVDCTEGWRDAWHVKLFIDGEEV